MVELPYALVIEATQEPDYFGFYSPDLGSLTGIGQSVGDCLCRAKAGMQEHVALLAEQGLAVPPPNSDPMVTIRNKRKWSAA